MMRRILPVLLAIMIIFLSACSGKGENEDPTGSSVEPSIKSEEMYDFDGIWKDEGEELFGNYFTACIGYGTIEIYAINEEDSLISLLWSGTFAPEKKYDTYVIESVNDHERTDYSEYGYTEDTVTLTFEEEKLKCSVSIMGFPKEFSFVYSRDIAEGLMLEMVNAFDLRFSPLKPEIVKSEVSIYVPEDSENYSTRVSFLVSIENPNEEFAVNRPRLLVSGHSSDGSLIELVNLALPDIPARDTLIYGGNEDIGECVGEKFEFKIVLDRDLPYMKNGDSTARPYKDVYVMNIEDNGPYAFKGWVQNDTDLDIFHVRFVLVYLKDGKMVVTDLIPHNLEAMLYHKASYFIQSKLPMGEFEYDEMKLYVYATDPHLK